MSLSKGFKRDIRKQINSGLALGMGSSEFLGCDTSQCCKSRWKPSSVASRLIFLSLSVPLTTEHCSNPQIRNTHVEYWAPGSYTQGLSWHHASFSNEFYFPIYFSSWTYLYLYSCLTGWRKCYPCVIWVVYTLSPAQKKGPGWLRIFEGPWTSCLQAFGIIKIVLSNF